MTTRGQFLKAGAGLAGLAALGASERRRREREAGDGGDVGKPNVVLVVADDLDRYVYDRMKDLEAAVGGLAFGNFYVSTSVCVPSRVSILRGQYAHNHGVGENANGASVFRERGLDQDTVATRMKEAGYATWFGGKYMNGQGAYSPDYKPPGWDSFSYYLGSKRADVNGRIVEFRDNYTDWLSRRAQVFLDTGQSPFFMQICTKDPHEPMLYPDRHAGKFSKATVPMPPSFDEEDLSDKPAWVRDNDPWTETDTEEATLEFRERLRSMSTTQDLVVDLLETLRASGRMEDTYVFFTSDNGFHEGLHALHTPKWTPYTEAHRVPFVVGGPGVVQGTTPALASNIDIAPTILDLAGVQAPAHTDGRSIKPILLGEQERVRDALLLEGEAHGSRPGYRAAKTEADTYVEYDTGEREYYLETEDPYQLDSRHKDPAYADVMAERAARVEALSGCLGDSCRAAEGP